MWLQRKGVADSNFYLPSQQLLSAKELTLSHPAELNTLPSVVRRPRSLDISREEFPGNSLSLSSLNNNLHSLVTLENPKTLKPQNDCRYRLIRREISRQVLRIPC